GRFSYTESALRALLRYRAPHVRIMADGKPMAFSKLLLGVVATGQYFGNGMRIAPEARLDDGWFDVLIASELSTLAALGLFARILLERPLEHSHLRRLRVRALDLECAEEVWLEADGEPIGTLPARV